MITVSKLLDQRNNVYNLYENIKDIVELGYATFPAPPSVVKPLDNLMREIYNVKQPDPSIKDSFIDYVVTLETPIIEKASYGEALVLAGIFNKFLNRKNYEDTNAISLKDYAESFHEDLLTVVKGIKEEDFPVGGGTASPLIIELHGYLLIVVKKYFNKFNGDLITRNIPKSQLEEGSRPQQITYLQCLVELKQIEKFLYELKS